MKNAMHVPAHTTSANYIAYLQHTLIPDLKDSGSDGHVQDYSDAIHWICSAEARAADNASRPVKRKGKKRMLLRWTENGNGNLIAAPYGLSSHHYVIHTTDRKVYGSTYHLYHYYSFNSQPHTVGHFNSLDDAKEVARLIQKLHG